MEKMKSILITGENSYIGNALSDWIDERYNNDITYTKLSIRTDSWKKENFNKFQSIVHVSGIAHNSNDKNLKNIYYEVNTDLTIKIAQKAKKDGVKHFIFLSSIIVYNANKEKKIDLNTIPNPSNYYSDSKLKAEEGLLQLQDHNFRISIIRPPMVYGPNCKGNFSKLSKISKKTLFFPDIKNSRSMIFISNLCEFLSQVIINEVDGFLYPQNEEYVKTSEIVKEIASYHNKKVLFIKTPKILIFFLSKSKLYKKIFGDLVYDKKMSSQKIYNYNIFTFKESIIETEKRKENLNAKV